MPYTAMPQRSRAFAARSGSRYWWFHQNVHVPPIFSLLAEDEWDVIEAWYEETDRRGSAGEANISCLSAIAGFIEGNGIPNIVQLGHFEGFSTLLLGFMMRRMGKRRAVFSLDIEPELSQFTMQWIDRARLSEQVEIVTASSDDPRLPEQAKEYFGADIATVFIDSAKIYGHTLRELDLWWPPLRPRGFVFMHDVSRFAAEDFEGLEGGVRRAVREWAGGNGTPYLLINEDVEGGQQPVPLVYLDGCGLGILQKPYVGSPGTGPG
jgi:predicted O-methyltransferase YrrM